MAVTGTLQLSGVLSGLASGQKVFNTVWSIVTGVGQVSAPLNLAIGDNTIAVPAGATLIVFTPPTGNANAIKVKGNAADTGWPIAKAVPTVLTTDGTGTLILNAAGAINACEVNFA